MAWRASPLAMAASQSLETLSIFIFSLFSTRVIIRNTNWKDRQTLLAHDIKYNPDSYQLVGGIGNVYAAQGNLVEAENHFIRATNLFPGLDTFSTLGYFYFSHKRFDEARRAFNAGLSYDPENAAAWYYFAISNYKAGNKQEGLVAAKKAYSISPNKTTLTLVKTIEEGAEINIQFK